MHWVRSYLACMRHLTRLGIPAVIFEVAGGPLVTGRNHPSRRGRELMDLLKYCTSRGVKVFCLAKGGSEQENDLRACGVEGSQMLFQTTEVPQEYTTFAEESRASLTKRGFQILLTVDAHHIDIDAMTPPTTNVAPVPLWRELDSTASAVRWALAYLGCVKTLSRKPAIVLDIDGTILINNKSGPPQCVSRIHALARACFDNAIGVYCVTARIEDPSIRRKTLKHLAQCGIDPIRRLFMRPEGADYLLYKKGAREAISDEGCQVLISVGDQFADVTANLPPRWMRDDRFYVGLFEGTTFGIKLPSEFA